MNESNMIVMNLTIFPEKDLMDGCRDAKWRSLHGDCMLIAGFSVQIQLIFVPSANEDSSFAKFISESSTGTVLAQ